MASGVNRKEQNGEQREQREHRNESENNQQSSWIGKKVTKTRSSPRPTSIGVVGKDAPINRYDPNVNSTNSIPTLPSQPIKPQSWSESNADLPVVNRLRIRDKLRPVSAAMAGKLRQRERRRAKRREPYMPSTEGTSTGDEGDELFQMDNVQNSNMINAETKSRQRHSIHQHGDNFGKVPPSTAASRRYSSPANRMNKSPSDLDADDEDNQDYDSASMISTSEIVQAHPRASLNPNTDDDAVFNAQVQEIRMAGMQQLAQIDGITGNGSAMGSACSSLEDQVGKMLEQERREKSALIQELGQKEQRIYEMEKLVLDLNRRLLDYSMENEHLKAENRALLQAMAKLSAAD